MTAYAAGRVSLNPLRHIDLVGTIIVPLVSLLLADILFGWAKPVPVNFANLRRPKQDMLWVAAAGPFSNLLMALAWALGFKFAIGLTAKSGCRVALAGGACGIFINVIFMVLNSAAAAAARRRAHRGEPAAAPAGVEIRADRALRLYDPDRAAVYRRVG